MARQFADDPDDDLPLDDVLGDEDDKDEDDEDEDEDEDEDYSDADSDLEDLDE